MGANINNICHLCWTPLLFMLTYQLVMDIPGCLCSAIYQLAMVIPTFICSPINWLWLSQVAYILIYQLVMDIPGRIYAHI